MVQGKDLNTLPPLQRWSTDQIYSPGKGEGSTVYARSGCFLEDISGFDSDMFKLTRAEALYVDPHARILLEHSQVCNWVRTLDKVTEVAKKVAADNPKDFKPNPSVTAQIASEKDPLKFILQVYWSFQYNGQLLSHFFKRVGSTDKPQ